MNFHVAYPPSLNGNAILMLLALCQGMDGAGKREFAATLDLQEPIARMDRYMLPGRGSLEGEVALMTTMAAVIRAGDRDLIEGALRSPRVSEPRIYVRSRDGKWADEGVAEATLRESLAMADVATLDLALEVFSGDPRHVLERSLPLFASSGREHGSALYDFAAHADAHPYDRVLACARWLIARHHEFVDGMFAAPGKETKGQAKTRAEQVARAKAGGPGALLDLSLQSGSANLAKAALELGAKADYHHAWGAFDNGAPELASSLWKQAEAGLADGSLDGGGSKPFEIGRHSRGDEPAVSAKKRRSICLEKLGESLASVERLLMEEKGASNWERERLASRMAAIGSFVMEVLAGSPGDKAAQGLMAAAMPISHGFESPAKWVRLARQSHPRPSPSELVGLAKAGKWALAATRLDDAEKSGKGSLPQSWLKEAAEACEKAFFAEYSKKNEEDRHGRSGAKAKGRDLGGMWSVKLSCELSFRDWGWPESERPVDKIKSGCRGEPSEISAIQSRFEGMALDKVSNRAEASAKGPLRV